MSQCWPEARRQERKKRDVVSKRSKVDLGGVPSDPWQVWHWI